MRPSNEKIGQFLIAITLIVALHLDSKAPAKKPPVHASLIPLPPVTEIAATHDNSQAVVEKSTFSGKGKRTGGEFK